MITPGQILLSPLSVLLFLLVATFGVFKEMDKMLNYSMKKKIKWWIFKNLYFDNRREEYLHGPVLENPNCGIYLPIFILILTTFFVFLVSLIWSLVLIFIEHTKTNVQIMTIFSLGSLGAISIVAGILYYVYESKYQKQMMKNIEKITQVLNERKQ